MMTAANQENRLPGPVRWADFPLDLLQEMFPDWRIARMGSLIRADQKGALTKYASNPWLMVLVLAGELPPVTFASQDCLATRQ